MEEPRAEQAERDETAPLAEHDIGFPCGAGSLGGL
jgi:hypothetical protein